jgi:hypothetical protein
MLAVVARRLGCEVCALEVGKTIQREGLKESALAQVPTHLDAPELEPIERLLVPFARETIWYEPAALQRRARSLRDPSQPICRPVRLTPFLFQSKISYPKNFRLLG